MRARVKPWMVFAVLATAGVGGAIAVFFAGSHLHASDRREIVAWQAGATVVLGRAEVLLREQDELGRAVFAASVTPAEAGRRATTIRTGLEEARRALLAQHVPAIVDAVAGAYLSSIAHGLAALSAAHQASFETAVAVRSRERTTFTTETAESKRLWRAGDEAMIELRARFSIEGAHY